MKSIIAKDGDMLDQIWFQMTGSEAGFDRMIDANGHLAHKYTLESGDVVSIPDMAKSDSPQIIQRIYGQSISS
jgi:phage tail protein X